MAPPSKKTPSGDGIRLQKIIADSGFCSRRKAEDLIEEARVTVNGEIAQIGMKVRPEDKVQIDERTLRLKPPASLTLLMNKPKGVLCTNHDPYAVRTVFSLLPEAFANERLFCAGRLDKDSEGMVILTNDGDLANRITHPSGGVIKRYHVTLNRPLDHGHIEKMLVGVTREGELLHALKIIPAKIGPEKELRCEVHLQQGRKREIRRLFEAFGYFVKRLKRFQMGQLTLRKVAPGGIRPLAKKDIESLFAS